MLSFFFRIFYYNCNNNFVNYFLFLFFLFISVLPTSLHYIFSYSVSTLINSQANIRLTVLFIQQMTCCPVSRLVFFKGRHFHAAALGRIGTSGMETTSAWRIHGTRNITLKDDSLSRSGKLRIRYRYCGKQCLGIRMNRVAVQLIAFTQLHQGA